MPEVAETFAAISGRTSNAVLSRSPQGLSAAPPKS